MSKEKLDSKQRALVKKYLIGYSWLSIWDTDKATFKERPQIERVNKKMKEIETQLKEMNVSEKLLGKLLKKAKKFVNMTVGEMNDKQRQLMCQLIFGKSARLEEASKIPKNAIVFELAKYKKQKLLDK